MLSNTYKWRCFLWGQNTPEVHYSHTRISGGGGVFLGGVSHSRQKNRNILVGTWNVRSLYRAGSPTAMTRELARYKSDLVGVQEVRWDKEGSVRAGDYNT
jgi:hypothetical protein